MEDEILTIETITGAVPTAKIRTLTNRMTTKTDPKCPANIVNAKITPGTNVKTCFKCGVLGNFRSEGRSATSNYLN